MEYIKITINNREIEAPAGSTILETAKNAGIKIPTLCYLKDINSIGACRMCVVEVKGARGLMPSCVTTITPGMVVSTDTAIVIESRKKTLDLICSNHRMDCEYCTRYSDCELHALCREYGLDDRKYSAFVTEAEEEDSSAHLIRDYSKCVRCRRCVSVCNKSQYVSAIGILNRGFNFKVGPAIPLNESSCIHCGQCITACPTGALRVKDDTNKVWRALKDPEKHVVAVVSPEVCERLGEYFQDKDGIYAEGKTIAILRRLGFDNIVSLDSAAAVAAVESLSELRVRLKNNEKLPLISSNCPSWVEFCEAYYPEYIGNLSSVKSPQTVLGALYKCGLAEIEGIDPKNIFIVSVKACTAGKFEDWRTELAAAGIQDVDITITTRELSVMIRQACVSKFTANRVWNELQGETFDPIPGIDSKHGRVIGELGGIMEAVITAETGTTAPLFNAINGYKDILEAEYELMGKKIKLAVTSGIRSAKSLMDMIKAGEKHYDYVEIMACPGGCMYGGGQPNLNCDERNESYSMADITKAFADKQHHLSDGVKDVPGLMTAALYEKYLGDPGSIKARRILHTTYDKRNKY
jgi:NADP-reducing hydrogenase subunit HndD